MENWRKTLEPWLEWLLAHWLPGILFLFCIGFMIASLVRREWLVTVLFAIGAMATAAYLGFGDSIMSMLPDWVTEQAPSWLK